MNASTVAARISACAIPADAWSDRDGGAADQQLPAMQDPRIERCALQTIVEGHCMALA